MNEVQNSWGLLLTSQAWKSDADQGSGRQSIEELWERPSEERISSSCQLIGKEGHVCGESG